MKPSFFDYDLRRKPKRFLQETVGALALLVLLLGILFIVLSEIRSWTQIAEGSYTPLDEVCENLERYVNGDDPEIVEFCKSL